MLLERNEEEFSWMGLWTFKDDVEYLNAVERRSRSVSGKVLEILNEQESAKQSTQETGYDWSHYVKLYLDRLSEVTDNIDENFENIDSKLDRIYLMIQSGFTSNSTIDEKLFDALENNPQLLAPYRTELLEILAERDMFRAVAGFKRKKNYVKKLWSLISTIETLISLIALAKQQGINLFM